MTAFIRLLLIPLLGFTRVSDGGWHRFTGVNVVLWLLAPASLVYMPKHITTCAPTAELDGNRAVW